jgi:sugar/nucleoside kinase (ribokinase family)
MDRKYDVITFGDLCVDVIVTGRDVVPEFGQKEKLVDDYAVEMGGSCGIFACQTAKLGLKTVVVGFVGNDLFGDIVVDTLKAAGVSLDHIKRSATEKTGLGLALNNGNDRATLTFNGTIDAIGREHIPWDLLENTRHLNVGSYYLMKRLQPHFLEIVRIVKSCGGTVSVDTNWDPAENWDGGIWDILSHTDMFFPNENEAMAIAGEVTFDEALAKLSCTVPMVAVKQGKDGAVLYKGQEINKCEALRVEAVDAVGAGDSFDAGFLYGYLSGMEPDLCLKAGCICGSLSTRRPGGTKGQPGREELFSYLYR